MKLSPFLERRARALATIAAAERPLASINVPGVRIKGTTNGSQGVSQQGRRFRRGTQRGLHRLGLNAGRALKLQALIVQRGALVVRITRVAPKRLDGDNLEASLKRVRDGLAKYVDIDDRDPSVEYVADDERGAVREYGVRFEVFEQVRGLSVVSQGREGLGETTIGPRTAATLSTRSPTPNVRNPRK